MTIMLSSKLLSVSDIPELQKVTHETYTDDLLEPHVRDVTYQGLYNTETLKHQMTEQHYYFYFHFHEGTYVGYTGIEYFEG